MICKVQRSLNVNGDRMLIYSKDRRTIWFEGTMTDDVAEVMGADLKCYVEARVIAKQGFIVERRIDRREWPTW